MATVTKAIRWGDNSNQNHHDLGAVGPGGSSGTSSGTGLLTANGISDSQTFTLVGLRMVVNSSLVRDTGCGCKLFALIPPGISTVREFKNHLSTNILKTHIPFYFYNGDYRIPDEEDIRIFSLLNEPCKVVPVPQPKSVLSVSSVSALNGSAIRSTSTPLAARAGFSETENGHGTPYAKRVKFSDTSFPLDVSGFANSNTDREGGGMDNVDQGVNGLSPDVTTATSKRRKRHRKHKSKKKNDIPLETEDSRENSAEEDSSKKANGIEQGQGPLLKKRRKHAGTPEYDADESEIDLSQLFRPKRKSATPTSPVILNGVNESTEELCLNVSGNNKSQEKSEFLSPNTAFSEAGGYKRIRTSSSTSGTNKEMSKPTRARLGGSGGSGSGFEHSCGEIEDGQNCDGLEVSGKRKDTPMLPKILKNPCATFELVKKSLSFEGDGFSPRSPPQSQSYVSQEEELDFVKLSGEIQDSLNPASTELAVKVECRGLKIGYYSPPSGAKIGTDYSIYFTQRGIMFTVPHAQTRQLVTCVLPIEDMFDAHFMRMIPSITLQTGPMFVKSVKKALGLGNEFGMDRFQGPKEQYEAEKKLVFLLTSISDKAATTINKIFGCSCLTTNQLNQTQCDVTGYQHIFPKSPTTFPVAAGSESGNAIDSPKKSKVRSEFSDDSLPDSPINGNVDISRYLLTLGPVTSVDLIKIGDTISFKVLELDENYTPQLSSLKVAEVVDTFGDLLEFKYFGFGEENKKQRSGVLEIDDEELGSEDLDNPKTRKFKDLKDPAFVLIKDK